MGGSRRKLKRSRTKVKVGLPRKNPHVFKPAFNLPPKLRSMIAEAEQAPEWDHKGSVMDNYKSFGFVSNPNIRGVSSRTHHLIESESLNIVPSLPQCAFDCECDKSGEPDSLSDPFDDGSDLEEDDLKSAMGKKRRDGKSAPLEPLTALQRVHISRLVEKHGDNYQSMFMDRKLNSLQHSIATLERLCKRYHENKNRNLMILPS